MQFIVMFVLVVNAFRVSCDTCNETIQYGIALGAYKCTQISIHYHNTYFATKLAHLRDLNVTQSYAGRTERPRQQHLFIYLLRKS